MEYRQQNEMELAIAEFDQLERRHPDYTAGYQMSAQTLMNAGRLQEAEQRLQAGVASARRTGNQHALSEMEGMLSELEEQNR